MRSYSDDGDADVQWCADVLGEVSRLHPVLYSG
jgi:hypothetical protein